MDKECKHHGSIQNQGMLTSLSMVPFSKKWLITSKFFCCYEPMHVLCIIVLYCIGDPSTVCHYYHWLYWIVERKCIAFITYKTAERKRKDFVISFGWDLAEWLERLTANAVVATILGSIPASSDTVESEWRQMMFNIVHKLKKSKKIPLYIVYVICF